jgi:putative PIN family toxin of toxin-antitoxin system
MKKYSIVIDTSVFITALRSKNGASFKMLSLIDSNKFDINISTPLILEYEDVAKREQQAIKLKQHDIDSIIDYICLFGKKRKIFYLWRPFLREPKDDFVLELAFESQSDFIITYNKKDFKGVEEKFNIKLLTPREFLQKIGELK